jgi:hypothetical protein
MHNSIITNAKLSFIAKKWSIVITANPTNRKYLALQIVLLNLTKHTCAHSVWVLLTKKNDALYGQSKIGIGVRRYWHRKRIYRMSMELLWNNTPNRRWSTWRKNLYQCDFVHHKSHITNLGYSGVKRYKPHTQYLQQSAHVFTMLLINGLMGRRLFNHDESTEVVNLMPSGIEG